MNFYLFYYKRKFIIKVNLLFTNASFANIIASLQTLEFFLESRVVIPFSDYSFNQLSFGGELW